MLRNTYTIKIKLKGYNIFNRDKSITVNFKEATIEETIDFLEKMEKGDFQIIELIYKIFSEGSKGKINKEIFRKYITNNISMILDILKKTYIKGVFNEESTEKDQKTDEKPKKMDIEEFYKDFGRLLAFLTNKMSIDPSRLIKTYTWSQLSFWTKHYLYNERNKTEEGRKENKREDNKDYIEKNKEEIEKSMRNIDKYLNRKI